MEGRFRKGGTGVHLHAETVWYKYSQLAEAAIGFQNAMAADLLDAGKVDCVIAKAGFDMAGV